MTQNLFLSKCETTERLALLQLSESLERFEELNGFNVFNTISSNLQTPEGLHNLRCLAPMIAIFLSMPSENGPQKAEPNSFRNTPHFASTGHFLIASGSKPLASD